MHKIRSERSFSWIDHENLKRQKNTLKRKQKATIQLTVVCVRNIHSLCLDLCQRKHTVFLIVRIYVRHLPVNVVYACIYGS